VENTNEISAGDSSYETSTRFWSGAAAFFSIDMVSLTGNIIKTVGQTLFSDLSQLIEQSRNIVVVQANSVMTMLFWNVGKRINEDVLQNKRADYGKQIVSTLSAQLEFAYGKNFTLKNIRRLHPANG
jgi:hypothetical protein